MRTVSLTILLLSILVTAAFAKEPKTYPEEGKVIGTGTTEHTHVGGSILGAPGGATNGSVSSRSKYTHTYKVETATRILELDCGKEAMFHSTGAECLAGSKPIQVGDVIHFRIEKDNAYIPLQDPSGTQTGEEKLRILSTEAAAPKKETPASSAAQAQPAAESMATSLLDIASTPSGADIEIDGKFVGSTPSAISIKPGDHDIAVKKAGFSAWEKKVSVAPGHINIAAELVAESK